MPKIIFMGTPAFAATILESLLANQYDIVAVVTQPDRPAGRKKQLTASAVKEVALAHQLPIFQPEVISDSSELAELLQLEADIIITAAYGQLLPDVLLTKPNTPAINVHASLLPKYRGGAPIQYAIWQGETETGVTIMYMVREMDAGDIITQKAIPIEAKDDAGSLFEKLAILGSQLLLESLPLILSQELLGQAQSIDEVTYSPTLKRSEEVLNWASDAREIDRHIRAFRPAPGTHTYLGEQRIKIWAGYPAEDLQGSGRVGEILAVTPDGLRVQAGKDSQFLITEWQESGKKRLSIAQWLNGNSADRLIGQIFGQQA